MKKLRLSIVTCFAVLLLAVSFSVPVEAADYTIAPFNDKQAFSVIYTNLSFSRSVIGGSVKNFPSGSDYYDLDLNTYDNIEFSAYVIFDIAGPVDSRLSNFNSYGVTFGSFTSPPPVGNVYYNYGNGTYINTLSLTAAPFFAIGPYNSVVSIDDLRIVHGDSSTVVPNLDNTLLYRLYVVYPVSGSFFGGTISLRGRNFFKLNSSINTTVTISPILSNNSAASMGDIKEQTDTLTNGYDNSGLNQSNSNLSGAITDYDSTESQITDSSVANIDGATFISPASNATLLTSVSFCTSWLQSLYVNLGDWSLLVAVSLSLALGLMLIGWFKYR